MEYYVNLINHRFYATEENIKLKLKQFNEEHL